MNFIRFRPLDFVENYKLETECMLLRVMSATLSVASLLTLQFLRGLSKSILLAYGGRVVARGLAKKMGCNKGGWGPRRKMIKCDLRHGA